MDGNKRLGLAIGTKRESMGMSQSALAEAVGCSPSFISQVESGRKRPNDEKLMKIMGVLQMNPYEVLREGARDEMTEDERTIFDTTIPLISKLAEYLTAEQFEEVMMLIAKANTVTMEALQYAAESPIVPAPQKWLELTKQDKQLVQRIINRLTQRKE